MSPQPAEPLATRVGEPFTIRVKGNPTTGFEWQAIFDPQAFEFVGRQFETGGGGIGGGGEETLTFRPLRPGRAAVTLELRRPFDKGSRESRAYDVVVEP